MNTTVLKRALKSLVVLAVVVCAVPLCQVASAQNYEAVLMEAIAKAREQGVNISDAQVQELLQILRKQTVINQEMESELDWAIKGGEAPPVSHVKGSEGIPFPDAAQSVWKPEPTATPAPTGAPDLAALAETKPYQQPGKCTANATRSEVFNEEDPDTGVLADFLFIEEEMIPLDVQDVFGARTSLVPYGIKAGEGGRIRMEIYRVPCVPYRIRQTNTTRYYDTGLNALKNYDSGASGRGTLHAVMQQKLFASRPKPAPQKPTSSQRRR